MKKKQPKKMINHQHIHKDNYSLKMFQYTYAVNLLLISLGTCFYFFYNRDFSEMFLKFTYQSNLLILIVMVLFFTRLRRHNGFKFLMFVAFLNILLTTIVSHFILDHQEIFDFITQVKAFQFPANKHFCHTLVPLFYIIFYFLPLNRGRITFPFYSGCYYPLLYVHILLLLNACSLKKNIIPYDFLNPSCKGLLSSNDQQGYLQVYIIIFILTIIFIFFSYLTIKLKNKLSQIVK